MVIDECQWANHAGLKERCTVNAKVVEATFTSDNIITFKITNRQINTYQLLCFHIMKIITNLLSCALQQLRQSHVTRHTELWSVANHGVKKQVCACTHCSIGRRIRYDHMSRLEQAQYVRMPITEERPHFILNLTINDLINARYSTHL